MIIWFCFVDMHNRDTNMANTKQCHVTVYIALPIIILVISTLVCDPGWYWFICNHILSYCLDKDRCCHNNGTCLTGCNVKVSFSVSQRLLWWWLYTRLWVLYTKTSERPIICLFLRKYLVSYVTHVNLLAVFNVKGTFVIRLSRN